MRKFNLKPKTYSHIVSGMMACSTLLSVMVPTASTLADTNAQNANGDNHAKKMDLNTSAINDKASLSKLAGLSSSQSNSNSSIQNNNQKIRNDTQNSNQKNNQSNQKNNQSKVSQSANNANNKLQVQKFRQTTQTQAHFNQLAVKRANQPNQLNSPKAPTSQITVTYTYNGKNVGEKSYNVPVGQSLNFANQLPSSLQRDYQVKPTSVQSYKATVPTNSTVNIDLAQNNSSENRQMKSENKPTYLTPLNKQDTSSLPSVQYTQARKYVVNPMLRPNNAPHYTSASQFKSEVPMSTKETPRDLKDVKPFKDFTRQVLQYKPYMDKVCSHYHMTHYETLLLAIMQVESGGRGSDVMQSSESVGLSPNSLNPQQSIEQGVRYLSNIVHHAQQMDKAEHQDKNFNKKDYHYYANDNRLLAQAYNYGGNFLDYVSQQKQGYTLGVSEKYSRDVVAPRLGNTNGSTYTYDNPISRMYHKDYLYTNGGNFYYGDLVEQYATNGYLRPVLSHLISSHANIQGDTNLIAKGLKIVGVNMPNNLNAQQSKTKPVKGGLKTAQAGDLVFFKGHQSSRVGFVMDPHTMFSADSQGAGFHSLDNHNWKANVKSVRRLPNADQLNAKANAHLDDEASEADSVNDSSTMHLGALSSDAHMSSGTHYQPSAVPANIKRYIHDPRDVGMDYGSSNGWADKASVSADQCVGFSCSYFPAIWHTSIRNDQGNGIDQVTRWSHLMNGKVSTTPHAGAIASSSNPALTGGDSAGHTFVVEHVFKDGSILVAEQNWPGLSGSDAGMTNTWDFAVLPPSVVDNGTTFFMPNTHQYHLHWK